MAITYNTPSNTGYVKRKKRREATLPGDYINNAEFHQEIVDWYASGDDEIPRNLVDKVWTICRRLGTKYNFASYTFNDELVLSGLEKCIKGLKEKRYDPTKWNNPLAYFTTAAWYEFLHVIEVEEKERYIKTSGLVNLQQQISLDPDMAFDVSFLPTDFQVNYDLIEKFEEKRRKKSAKKTSTVNDEPILDTNEENE